MKASEFEEKKIYSEASGSMSVVDSNISIQMNKFGLFEEVLANPNKDIEKIAELVSPNLNSETNESEIAEELYSEIVDVQYDKRIGFYTSLFVGHVLEGNYRSNASSGGMGTWIFKELLEQDMIDYVIHVKKNQENSEHLFKYDISSSIDEIIEGAKTRYYPVELSEVFRIVKNKPGRYAIIGIPSFIYAVRLLCKYDQTINDRIKYTIGLICGHQKSSKFAESMAWQMGIKPGDLVDIDFRYKLPDQPASSYAVKVKGYMDGELKTIIKPTSELYGQDWGWGFFKPVASNFTDDVFNETADIVLGDAWLQEYISDSQGNNVLIIRNEELDQLIKGGIRTGKLKMESIDKETIFRSQAAHYRHTHDELAYRLYKRKKAGMWVPQKRIKSNNKSISLLRKRVQELRKELSKQSHYKYAEAVEKDDFNHFIDSMSALVKEYKDLYRIIRWMGLPAYIRRMGLQKFVGKVGKRFTKK